MKLVIFFHGTALDPEKIEKIGLHTEVTQKLFEIISKEKHQDVETAIFAGTGSQLAMPANLTISQKATNVKVKIPFWGKDGAIVRMLTFIPEVCFARSWPYKKTKNGWHDIVNKALQLINGYQQEIEALILIGYSRGCAQSHMLANESLNDKSLKAIPIYMLDIEPVLGPIFFENICGYPSEYFSRMGENVKVYRAFYARDEHSPFYTPLQTQLSAQTNSKLYHLPGNHLTIAGLAYNFSSLSAIFCGFFQKEDDTGISEAVVEYTLSFVHKIIESHHHDKRYDIPQGATEITDTYRENLSNRKDNYDPDLFRSSLLTRCFHKLFFSSKGRKVKRVEDSWFRRRRSVVEISEPYLDDRND